MKRRGLTLIELLVAVLIMGVSLTGLMGLWTFGFNTTSHSQDIAAGYNIARREVERYRNVGFYLLPNGTTTQSYDGFGAPTTGTPHYIATSTMQTLPDANGNYNVTCLRRLDVQVVAADRSNEVVFATTTYFTRGGI